MTQRSRIALVGNSLPRQCGIATFTTDLQQALAASSFKPETTIVAMNDHGVGYDYPPVVRFQVEDQKVEDFAAAAEFLNAGRYDVVSLQHEFGIFGGEAGEHILALLAPLRMPVVTTLHTVLVDPTLPQRRVLERVVAASSSVVVMAEKARQLLRAVYGVPADRIEVVPHGIPDFAFVESDAAKARFGYVGRTVILTFGLLSPSKGIEVMIDAMPAILRSRPDAVYLVLGATHPNLVRHEGESYRESLLARTRHLGIEQQVVFLDQFVDQAMLLDYISMCDVYVTPYLNEQQMTSGTLAYSFGLGKPVVSTPYWHAQELLANGRGILVAFGDAAALGTEISSLLTDDRRRKAIRRRAYEASRPTTWARVAERYLTVFAQARRKDRLRVIAPAEADAAEPEIGVLPPMRLDHLLAMCDDTGLFQHAVHSVPDRHHGYCVDDNARALLLACALNHPGEQPLPDRSASQLASFVQHAWNPDTKRFRNFMSFDRRWLEDAGSEDSHGRTLWALGECARSDASSSRRRWASALFLEALPVVEGFKSPRAWAFTLLGVDAMLDSGTVGSGLRRIRQQLADRLMKIKTACGTDDWPWFEDTLAYDNARLPQALIVTGVSAGVPAFVEAGLSSLRWIMDQQTTPGRLFRPVGTESFGRRHAAPKAYDQQPLEAAAAISACLAAHGADGDPRWHGDATIAFAWFLGRNDLGTPLVDPESGSCRDGLHRDRANENRGGESVVSYLLSLAEMRRVARTSRRDAAMPVKPLPLRA